MSARYKYINWDLLLSTAMLHNIGKIYELSKTPGRWAAYQKMFNRYLRKSNYH
ncbi:MAG: hypothetical protein LBR83_03010 [Clostridiales bacterium]|jgi:23S rRNA maturation-related 3'-5' exoribonuclease YhaM|nr:hypothetical protein [Clostridiales bacterium]